MFAVRESMMTEFLARDRLLHWGMAGALPMIGIVVLCCSAIVEICNTSNVLEQCWM